KHLYLLISVILLTVFLSGCTQVNEPINADSTGIWNEYFVYPLSTVITFFAKQFIGSYGLAIVVVTVIVRLFLVTLNVKQVKITTRNNGIISTTWSKSISRLFAYIYPNANFHWVIPRYYAD